jgi:hypothetical protein
VVKRNQTNCPDSGKCPALRVGDVSVDRMSKDIPPMKNENLCSEEDARYRVTISSLCLFKLTQCRFLKLIFGLITHEYSIYSRICVGMVPVKQFS